MSDCFDHMADAWDDALFNGDRYDGIEGWTSLGYHRRPTVYGPPLKCKHCGAAGLYWQKVQGRYVIYSRSNCQPHRCDHSAIGAFTEIKE